MMNITDKRNKSLVKDKRVLITGASSGLGKELACLFAQDNKNLVLLARSKSKLEKLSLNLREKYNIEVDIIIQDLSKLNAVQFVFDKCQTSGFQIDVLVNNAGFAYWGEFLNQEEDSVVEMLNLMIVNTTLMTHLFGKEMRRNSEGKIIQIASTAAFQAGPFMAAYFASKAFLLLLSEAIQLESEFPRVQIICPGAFHSKFEKRSKMESVIFFNRAGVPSAEAMAQKIFRFVKTDGRIFIPGFSNKLIVFLIRFSPRIITHKIIALFLSKK